MAVQFAAWLARERDWPCHFTRRRRGRVTATALRNLAVQLIARFHLDERFAPGGMLPETAGEPGWFDQVLHAAAAVAGVTGEPLVIVVDGLDEAEHVAGDLPLGLPSTLPPGVFFVVTCRTGTDLPALRRPWQALSITAEDRRNTNDLRRFLTDAAKAEPLASLLAQHAVPVKSLVRDLVEIAMAVPTSHAARLAPRVVTAVQSRFGVLSPERVGELVVRLCDGEHGEDALSVASALLARLTTGEGPTSGAEVYEYAEILREHLPRLVQTVGMQALALFADLLAEVLGRDLKHHDDTVAFRDGSRFWRPGITGYEHQAESDLRHALVNAVRDAAQTLADSDPSRTSEIATTLKSYRWTVFRRLALHLLTQHPDAARDLVAAQLCEPGVLRDRDLQREYLQLAHSGASCLDSGTLRRLLTLIDDGPHGDPHTSAPEYAARWRRDRLASLRGMLPIEWEARYQALVAEYGAAYQPTEPDPDLNVVFHGSPAPPVSADDLAAMSTDTLIEFLLTWQPPEEDRWRLTAGALRGVLATAVRNDRPGGRPRLARFATWNRTTPVR
ncbi:hypothetical protein ACQPW3_22450 [Actinosynnema sp. CA-248983]